MLTDGLYGTFNEGKKHVIPLLFAVLPGIDPNDIRKFIATSQFMTTFVNMIPLVDCSTYSQFTNLTMVDLHSRFTELGKEELFSDHVLLYFKVEEEVASATSQFEEFVIQYMDRMFTFIESAAQEDVRIENNIHDSGNSAEEHLLVLMENTVTIFGQSSPEIFQVNPELPLPMKECSNVGSFAG